ncbi:hypothetical protein BJY04DRAFT_51563 [Aspergillus karnatakaensis]|uniref:uncharacterized protein n=1 Tax=Aspergillus karnatakaensis TaxID=1810916 RepID=UPI003CCCB4D0
MVRRSLPRPGLEPQLDPFRQPSSTPKTCVSQYCALLVPISPFSRCLALEESNNGPEIEKVLASESWSLPRPLSLQKWARFMAAWEALRSSIRPAESSCNPGHIFNWKMTYEFASIKALRSSAAPHHGVSCVSRSRAWKNSTRIVLQGTGAPSGRK